jgi:DNA-binding HxlR family transcriptional regulator
MSVLEQGGTMPTSHAVTRDATELMNSALEIIEQEADGGDLAPLRARLQRRTTQMGQDSMDRRAPVREVLARLGDKWSPLLLIVLEIGEFRHTTLRRLVSRLSHEGRISQRMLTLRLRSLERDGLIERRVLGARPPKVSYAITELGRGLLTHIDTVITWTHAHTQQINAARERFEHTPPPPDPGA